jgi:hypothetical protein
VTSGDVNNINFAQKSTRRYERYEKMQEVAEKVAGRVHEAEQHMLACHLIITAISPVAHSKETRR